MKRKFNCNSETPPTRPARPVSNEESEHNGALAPNLLPGSPSEEQRQAAKAKILEAVSGCLESRIEEVFEMADEGKESEIGPDITWRHLTEVRWQICGCIADDLHYDLGHYVEEIMLEEFQAKGSAQGVQEP